jgi:transposase
VVRSDHRAGRPDPDLIQQWVVGDGVPPKRVGELLGLSRSAGYEWLRRYGIGPGGTVVATPDLVAWWRSGATVEELATRTGLPAPAIRERLVTVAVLSSPRRYLPVGSPDDPLTVEQLRRWCVRDGFSAPQIAALSGTTARQVRYRLTRYGLSRARPGPPATLRLRLTEPHLRNLYERERLSCPQIAAGVGVSTEAVRRLLVEYGIERRPSGPMTPHRMRHVGGVDVR